MPRKPNPADFRYPVGGAGGVTMTGFDRVAFSNALDDYREKQFEEFFGFPKRFSNYNNAAADAAQAEYEQAVRELEGGLEDIRGSDLAQSVEDFYRRQAAGELAPYDETAMRSLVTSATEPVFQSSREAIDQARQSFASRGLSRSGTLADLEARYRMRAAQQAAMQGSDLRSRLVGQNFASRERGGAGLAGHFNSRQGLMNQLRSQLASLRASRQFDPAQFLQGGGIFSKRKNPTRGGYSSRSNLNFNPPSTGSGPNSGSAPRYGNITRVA